MPTSCLKRQLAPRSQAQPFTTYAQHRPITRRPPSTAWLAAGLGRLTQSAAFACNAARTSSQPHCLPSCSATSALVWSQALISQFLEIRIKDSSSCESDGDCDLACSSLCARFHAARAIEASLLCTGPAFAITSEVRPLIPSFPRVE